MLVKDLLKAKSKELVTADDSLGIREAMRVLIENKISCLLVTDNDNNLRGIMSDKDIFKLCYEKHCDFASTSLSDLVTSDVIVGVESDDLGYIAGLMTNNRIRHVPIVDGEKLVGLVSIGDVVKAQMADLEAHNRYLHQYIDGSYPA